MDKTSLRTASQVSSAAPSSSSKATAIKSAKVSRQQIDVGTILKLTFFAVLMACLPISTYFYTSLHIFNETEYATTYAAISAAGMANVVAFGYVLMAVMDDQPAKDPAKDPAKEKKTK